MTAGAPCWSCEKNPGNDALCGACGAVQPLDPGTDHFAVLGIERRFSVDLAAAERRYKDASRVVHPDRFAQADPRARKASLQRSVALNDAWKTLRDPLLRAEYLLSLHGISLADGAERRPKPDGPTERVRVAPELLMEVLDLRESLMEARLRDDDERVAELATQVRGRRDAALAEVARGFEGDTPLLGVVAQGVVSARYFTRFLDEVAAHEEARAEVLGEGGGGRGG